MSRKLGVAVVAAAALLASGCGGRGTATVEELGRTVILARDRVDFAFERITQAQSREELLERMDEAAGVIDDVASDLEGVGAPERLETEVSALVGSLQQLAFDVQATADQIRQPGFSDLFTGTKGLSFASWNAVNRALAALGRQDIDVAPLTRH